MENPLPPRLNHHIAVRWIRLEALQEGNHERCAEPSISSRAWLSGIRIPDPFSSKSKLCDSCVVPIATLSSIFWRSKDSRSGPPSSAPPFASVSFTPTPGTYAYDFLQSKFKELDVDDFGYISEGDLKAVLKRLRLPASEKDVQGFLNRVGSRSNVKKVSFEDFAEYAVHLENELVDTFKELDKRKTGYITPDEMKASLRKYNFRITDNDVDKMVHQFHARGNILQPSGYYRSGHVFDFAEFRELLMLMCFKDLRDPGKVWGRAVLDLGDVDICFPLSSGNNYMKGKAEQKKSKHRSLNHLLSGFSSAFISRTAVAPLERVKILSMVRNSSFTKNGIHSAVLKIWREEGIQGLFRGNLLNILRIAPTKILEYLLYSNSKEMVLRKASKTNLNGTEVVLLGAAASMAATLISHPIDTVRTTLTVQDFGTQMGILESTRTILKDKGLSGVYRGIMPNMMRILPYLALNYAVYNELEKWYRKKHGPGGKLEPLPTVCFGVLGGAVAQVAVYPLETVQRRLQAQALQQCPVTCHNMIDAFKIIMQDEGLQALYAGLSPNLLKILPAAAISFIAYEALNKTLESKEWVEAQKSMRI